MEKLILVGGGTGFIGRHLIRNLETIGYSTLTISRQRRQSKSSKIITWDEVKRNGIPDNVYGVVNLAGQLALDPTKRWNETLKNNLCRSRIDTTALLRDCIAASSNSLPTVWISISGVGYYPAHQSKVYSEDYICEKPDDFWTKLTTAWENASILPLSVNNVRHVIVRSGVVLGKDGGAIPQMKPPFLFGLGGPIGSGQQWFPWIHIDDIVGILMHAIETKNVNGVLNGVAPTPERNSDFSKCFGRALSRPSFITLPGFVVKGVFGEVRAKILLEGQNVDPKRTLELGYRYKYPKLEDALKEIVS